MKVRQQQTSSPLDCNPRFAFHARMPRTRIAALEFALRWQSPIAHHAERVYFERLSFWRDFFPGQLADADPLHAVWGSAA